MKQKFQVKQCINIKIKKQLENIVLKLNDNENRTQIR